MPRALGLLAGALLALPCAANATVVVLQPPGATGKDTQIDNGAPNTNWEPVAAVSRYLTVNWQDNNRSIGLIEFDLSSIPGGAAISSATLSLYHELNTCNPCRYDVFRITSAWTEGTVTYNTAPTIDPVAWASLVIGDSSAELYRSWDVTALVSAWVNGVYSNFGMWIEEIPVQGTRPPISRPPIRRPSNIPI